MNDHIDFIDIVQKYNKPLFNYCFYKLREDMTLTEETLNDIFSVLYQKWDALDINDNIKAYLYRVADICIRSNLSKHFKYYTYNQSLDEAMQSDILTGQDHYDIYFRDDEKNEEEYIEQIKNALPEEYRKIFVYRYIEKKTLTEISDILKIPYSSLRLRIRKLEKAVKEEIHKIFN